MLDVSFMELPRGAEDEVLTNQFGLGMHQGHHILELVSETESAAGLIIPAAGP